MSNTVIVSVLEALEIKYGRDVVMAAVDVFKQAGEAHALSARGVVVNLSGVQFEQISGVARAGNKIEAIQLLRNFANPADPRQLPVVVAKEMIESIN